MKDKKKWFKPLIVVAICIIVYFPLLFGVSNGLARIGAYNASTAILTVNPLFNSTREQMKNEKLLYDAMKSYKKKHDIHSITLLKVLTFKATDSSKPYYMAVGYVGNIKNTIYLWNVKYYDDFKPPKYQTLDFAVSCVYDTANEREANLENDIQSEGVDFLEEHYDYQQIETIMNVKRLSNALK